MSLAKIKPVLTNKRINDLFNKFSWPLLRACITDHQKTMGTAMSRILWFRLLTGEDNEERIYQDLQVFFPNDRDSIVAFASLYFFKMKPALKESSIKKLRQRFAPRGDRKDAGTLEA